MGQQLLSKPPWRWPLGWLYVLTLVLAATLVVRLGWIYFHYRAYHQTGHWFLLAPVLWLLLLGVGLLALVLLLSNLFRRRRKRALAWGVLSVLAPGFCGLISFPLA